MYKEHRSANTPSDDRVIYRYRNFDRLQQIISGSYLYFSRLDQLQDEHEGRYPEGNLKPHNREKIADSWRQEHVSAFEEADLMDIPVYRGLIEKSKKEIIEESNRDWNRKELNEAAKARFIEDVTDKIAELVKEDPRDSGWEQKARREYFVNCWQIGGYESYPMWKAYTNPKESVVIVSTIGDWKEALSQHIIDHIYISEINYIDLQSGQIPEKGQLHLALQKRMEYRHEDEVRGILSRLPPLDDEEMQHPKGIEVKIGLEDLVNEIRVSPDASEEFFEEVQDLCNRSESLNEDLVKWSSLK